MLDERINDLHARRLQVNACPAPDADAFIDNWLPPISKTGVIPRR